MECERNRHWAKCIRQSICIVSTIAERCKSVQWGKATRNLEVYKDWKINFTILSTDHFSEAMSIQQMLEFKTLPEIFNPLHLYIPCCTSKSGNTSVWSLPGSLQGIVIVSYLFLSFFLRFPCGGSKFGDIDIHFKDCGSHLMRSLLGKDKLITTGIFRICGGFRVCTCELVIAPNPITKYLLLT